MARILANRFALHGNKNIMWLEKEIFIRLSKDSKKFGENRNSQGVKRVFFGLTDGDQFDWESETGSAWAYFQERDDRESIVIISPYPAITVLQDYITRHAAKLDPKVIVQLEYEDISGAVIGTRLTSLSLTDGIDEYKAHKFTPTADNKELSRSAMSKIKSSQRSAVKKMIAKKLNIEYKSLDLEIFSYS